VARANIIHNTIINNDSTATASVGPARQPLVSDPQPAVWRARNTALRCAI
jgi:hypothetical protein